MPNAASNDGSLGIRPLCTRARYALSGSVLIWILAFGLLGAICLGIHMTSGNVLGSPFIGSRHLIAFKKSLKRLDHFGFLALVDIGEFALDRESNKIHRLLAEREGNVNSDKNWIVWSQKSICSNREPIVGSGIFHILNREFTAHCHQKTCRINQIDGYRHFASFEFIGFPRAKFHPLAQGNFHESRLPIHKSRLFFHQVSLTPSDDYGERANDNEKSIEYPRTPVKEMVLPCLFFIDNSYRRDARELYVLTFILGCYASTLVAGISGYRCRSRNRWRGNSLIAFALASDIVGTITGGSGLLPWQWCNHSHQNKSQEYLRHRLNVTRKVLTSSDLSYYTKYMANVLSMDKQAGIIGALCEGSSIRSIERMTGVHRDTIMRLGVRVGRGCMELMDETMRGFPAPVWRWMKSGASSVRNRRT
jgi:hypothetical protein